MNKLQMVAAVSAMTLVASAPAFAEQTSDERGECVLTLRKPSLQ